LVGERNGIIHLEKDFAADDSVYRAKLKVSLVTLENKLKTIFWSDKI